MSTLEITLGGGRAVLLPDRALHLPEHDSVLVADLHWGKAAAFRAANVPVPTGTTASDLARLTRVLHETRATQLVVLGDLLHAKSGRQSGTLDAIAAWRTAHPALRIVLVRGNHDAHAGDPPPSLEIDCVDAPWILGPFACAHHPDESDAGYVLAGHLHPHVSLGGRGRQRVKLPCFAFGLRVGLLPAFAEFTGTGAFRARGDERLFAIADGAVVAIGASATQFAR